ncbi:S8 family serine peptidase [Virgisporangium ochraceum]|uniref:Peptidase S8 n=1 Tax=Virgisporangium ochraceum TaxID=65505 RepID=A0A8J3ZUH2_9ACTN|nr:S8 family serine peptidase [Virgisporangium ochraceum]GIJ70139.1 peptidase S8 [Virgisporangium ochraceum]
MHFRGRAAPGRAALGRAALRAAVAILVLPPVVVLAGVRPGVGNPQPGLRKTADLTPVSRAVAAKTPVSRLARSDGNLLARTDSAPVQVVVKLDYEPVATYAGTLPGLPATGPAYTGRPLAGSAEEERYEEHIRSREAAVLGAVAKRVPAAVPGQRLRTVYGGVTFTAPANRLRDLASVPGVVAVQADSVRRPLTDSSAEFIGAAPKGTDTDGAGAADGAGVLVGVLDTGAWPEHPSFAETPTSQAPPLKADGTPRTCDFGPDPTVDGGKGQPFRCNRKLVGGAAFLSGYLADAKRAAEEKYSTARDSNGHGTHTASTAVGNVVDEAPVFGVDRGPVRGVAPGAWLSVYKVCGAQGCLASDSVAAIGQAIRDGVQVINFSISGGTSPQTDPAELAFLDAYAAGVFVAASAGNDGPGVGTANHLAPWVTTVAASTQRREFVSTLTLKSGSTTETFEGASITAGIGPAPVVLAESVAGYRSLCGTKPPADAFKGRIVACERGGNIGRVDKGNNVKAGGAVGMILYNPTLQDVETDNHWLPTVHLADGAAAKKFLTDHKDVTGSFTAGTKRSGRPDVMAAFSSRGPAGAFVKPDVTAPGVQILAGHTPTPEAPAQGPPGERYQAIAGTSMSSPHVAGGAAWLKARHPDWSPGRIRSALMTTATTEVVKEDLKTPADAFDMGAGRIRLDRADTAGLVFDETATRLTSLAGDAVNAVHLNLPSVNAPVVPGRVTTVRTATNVTGRTVTYRTAATTAAGATVSVLPATLTVLPGRSAELSISIRSEAATRQFFGGVTLQPATPADGPALHLPVAFVPRPGPVTVTSTCTPEQIAVKATSLCTVTASNATYQPATVDMTTTLSNGLTAESATGAMIVDPHQIELRQAKLPGMVPGTPSLGAGQIFGYQPLDRFGIGVDPIGDEEIVNFDLPTPTVYGGQEHRRIGVTSNGYLVVGGGDEQDVVCCEFGTLPNPARPNNVLAPFWTDLDGAGAPGVLAGVLSAADGSSWLAVEWRLNVYGTTSQRVFQAWMRLGGTEEIGFAYPADALPADPGKPVVVGAENVNGTGGDQLDSLPTGDVLVTTSKPVPGGSVTYSVTVRGTAAGDGTVVTRMDSPQVPGVTTVTSKVTVK